MKFIVGLLTGTLGVLAVWSLIDFSWQPPTRMGASPNPAAEQIAPPLKEPEPAKPLRSVTIEPLPADPAPQRAPVLVTSVEPPAEKTPANSADSIARAADSEAPVELATAEPAAMAAATAVVWKPFHSEVSASGFARRLSVQLGYPFRALREGPAKYHVVFDYGSDEQRELLREQVKALTGFSVI